MESAIYLGTLRHRRFRPVTHEFAYPLFMVFLDIDRLPALMEASALTAYNRWAWATFDEADHFGDSSQPLRHRLAADAFANGIALPDGPIFLLTHLRYLGYNFNPVSFFYCYDRQGALKSILAEVNSTFGESRNYWLTGANRLDAANAWHYRTGKRMHVSPFMPMGLDYHWVFTAPADQLVVHMRTVQDDAPSFDATLDLRRRPWNPREIRRALIRHPLMTAKVIGAIHWQALRLFLKQVPVYTHPARLQQGEQHGQHS
jgi:hypothetical protein